MWLQPQKFAKPPYWYQLWQEIKKYKGEVVSGGMMFVHHLSIRSTDNRGKTYIFNDNKKRRNTDLMIT
jgi:hypothetical protein